VSDPQRKGGKLTTKLVALSSAGVVAVYAAGFYRTKAAADRLAEADRERRRPDVVPIDPARLEALASRAPQPPGDRRVPAAERPAPAVTFTLPTRPAPPRPDRVTPMPPSPAADKAVSPSEPASTTPTTTASTTAPVPASSAEPAPSAPAEPALAAPASQPPASDAQPQTGAAPAPKPFAGYKDGTYLGWGSCRHGDIQASVTIAAGRVTEAKIAQCWTRYSCSWIDPIVPQVVARQSPNVDYVSGATQSVDAFYWAVIDALSKAK
jgi:uncharacterized protein with FMN-binding domain